MIHADSVIEKDDEEESQTPSVGKRFDDHGHSQHNPLRDESWDLASRYRDLQRLGHLEEKKRIELSERAIEGVVARAHELLGPVQKPYHYLSLSFEELNSGQHDYLAPELDVEETLLDRENPVFQARLERDHGLVLVLDTSLSMKGEKLALLAATVAAVALSVPSSSLAILGFDAQIHEIKQFNEAVSLHESVKRVLSIPPGGFTNISKGLSIAKEWIQASPYRQARVILISDGRYTEGADPTILSRQLPFVYPVKIGKEPMGREVMRAIADTGLGQFMEVREMRELPFRLLRAIRSWVR